MNTSRLTKALVSVRALAWSRPGLGLAAGLCWWVLLAVPGHAAPVSPEQARLAAERWLAACPAPLGAPLVKTKAPGETVGKIEPLKSAKGLTLGYVVSLSPEGYLILAADTRLRPVIAFCQSGVYDPRPESDLAALLSLDLPARLAAVQTPKALRNEAAAKAVAADVLQNEAAWADLLDPAKASGVDIVTEEWVPPLVKSTWSQGAVAGRACFNYYTPLIGDTSYTFDPGNPNNIVCGCVATATAQILRYFEWPQAGIGYKLGSASITFHDPDAVPTGVSINQQLRGGNGNGGPYDWAAMTLSPQGTESEHSLQQIGALCFDAGLSVGMSYNIQRSNMSGANFSTGSFRNFFNYAGARGGGSYNDMRANLDARRPVALTIGMTTPLAVLGGHAIVGHGYGRVDGRWYYRFEMGAGGVWYNLEEYFYTGTTEWSGVGVDVFNIYRKALQPNENAATGVILSGRITDAAGNPVPGVHVEIRQSGNPATFLKMMPWNDPDRDYTDERGIWAIDKVPDGAYDIVLTKPGLEFSGPFEVTVAGSNRWGLNFTATATAALTLQNWWYDDGTLMPGALVVVLQFNRPIGAVTVDPTKLTLRDDDGNSRALTGATAIFQTEGSPYVILLLNATDAAALRGFIQPDDALTLDMARTFLMADVDGQGSQAGEDDAEPVPVAPRVAGRAEDPGLPVNPAAPQVVETRLRVGAGLAGPAGSPCATSAGQIQFLARFSTPVSGVDANDFRPRVTSSFTDVDGDPAAPQAHAARPDTPIPSAVVTAVQPVDAALNPAAAPSDRWLVTVDVGRGDGFIRLDVVDDDSITNGTPLGGPGAHNGDFFYSPYAFHVDNLGPVIVAATLAADNSYVTITWNEPVGGTDSLEKTASLSNLPDTYRWQDRNGGGLNAGDAIFIDRGAAADNVFHRAHDRPIYEAPNEPGLQEGTVRTATLNSLVSPYGFYYDDVDGVQGPSPGDNIWVGASFGATDTFGDSGNDTAVLGSPYAGEVGRKMPNNVVYYSASGAPGGIPDAAWFASFLTGSNNGVWQDFSAPDGIYTAPTVDTVVDLVALGTPVAGAGNPMPADAMFLDTNANGRVDPTDLVWLDGTGTQPDQYDGSDTRLDTNGSPLPGILFSVDLQVLFKKNGGTVTSVGISNITNGDGSPMTQGSNVIRAYLRYTPPLDLGGAAPSLLNQYRVPAGVETIEIVPVENSVFDALGNAADTQTTTGEMKLYDVSVPRVVNVILADDNYSAQVIFSERVYTNPNGVSNHNPDAIRNLTGNLTTADFSVTKSWGGSVTIDRIAETLGSNVCTLLFRQSDLDPPPANGYLILNVGANQIFDVRGNAVPNPAWQMTNLAYKLPPKANRTPRITPPYDPNDPDSLPPLYFTNQGYGTNNTIQQVSGRGQGPSYTYYYGYYYRDVDGDGRVDAVDLNFYQPDSRMTLNLPSNVASQFTVWVQRNDDADENGHTPEQEAGHYPGPTGGGSDPFTADWSTVTVTSVTDLGDRGEYWTIRLNLNQSQIPVRTHGERWIMVRYKEPQDNSFDYAPGEAADYSIPPETNANTDQERDGIYWFYDPPTDDQGEYFCIGSFRVIVWDGAPARPVSATMWRVANYFKQGESGYGSYDYLDLVFSEPLSAVSDSGWSPGASYGVHEKDGPYGPEIIDLLGERRTVRVWYNSTSVTGRAFSGGSSGGSAPVVDGAPARNATPYFAGTAIGVRNLDSRYRVLGFSADGAWTDMLQVEAEGAQIVQYSSDDRSTAGATHALSTNRVTLKSYDQGGFNPSSDAHWRRSDTGATFLVAGHTDLSTGNTNAAIVFAAAANNSAVTPGDAFLAGIQGIRVQNSQVGAAFDMTAPAVTESGPVYAMVKVNPITTSGTSRLDEQERRVLGIDAAGRATDVIDAITVRFVDTSYGQFDPAVDLLPLADDATSGVRLYRTFGTAGLVQLAATGLEWSDWQINDEGHPYRQVVLRPLASQPVPLDDADPNTGFEYEIRIVTSTAFNLGDSFYVEIPDNGILFRRAASRDDFPSGWDTKDGTPGLALTDHVYHDANNDLRWGMGETIVDSEYLVAINGRRVHDVPFYDGGVPYAHLVQNRNLLSAIRNYQRNFYYAKRGAAPNPDTVPEPPGAMGSATDTDYNVVYSPGDDVWYDIGGKLGAYDAGVDIPVVGNSDLFRCPWSPHEEGARSPQIRGAAPASVNPISGNATVAAGSAPTAVVGIDMHDSGRTFGPRYAFGIRYGFIVEAVSKSLPGGTYTNAIAYVASARTLSWRGGPAVNVAAPGRYLLADPDNKTFIVVSVWDGDDAGTEPDLPEADATATLVVSADVDRDVQQPAAIRGVRIHAVGPGNVPGKTGILRLSGTALSWQSDSAVGGTRGADVDVSAGGMFVLSAERPAEDYLVVQVGQARGAASEELAIYPADGRNITPFLAITGLDIVAVSSVVDQGTYRFTYDGAGSLSWADGDPTNITGPAGTQTIVPGNASGTAFVVVRRTGEPLPDAPAEDYLFLNQAALLRIAVTVTDQGGFTSTHLAPLTGGPDSGIALFRDANANGVFDGPGVDEFVPLATPPVFSGAGTYTLTLVPDPTHRAAHLPNSHVAPAVGNDYFITVRTTYDISYGDRFSLSASVYEPTEPNTDGAPSFASGSSGTITCTSVTNTVYNDATRAPWTVDAGTRGVAAPVALFGVDHFLGVAGTVYLQTITFTLRSVNGFNPDEDLMSMTDPNQALRGVMLYQDTNANGTFGAGDTLIPCDIVTTYDYGAGTYRITLLPIAMNALTQVPVNSDGGLSDHFVCINLSPDIDYGDEFYCTVEVNDIYYSTGVGNAASRLATHSLTATITSRYNDLTSRVQVTPTAGLVVNGVGSAVTDGYHQVSLSFNPATGTYSLTWNGFTVPIDPTRVGTYTLGSGNNTLTVTFDPRAFFNEDALVDGDGTASLRAGVPDTPLGTPLLPLQGSSPAGGQPGGVYYVDIDLNGQFSPGDAIILAGNPGLVYNAGIDAVVLGTPVGGVLTAPADGLPLLEFVPADRLAFADANGNGACDDGEDIVRDTDAVYSLPWLDMVLDTDGDATPGIGPGSLVRDDDLLVGAETVSVDAGAAVPGFGGLYYFDADDSGSFTHGDDIVVQPLVGGVIPNLVFDAGLDQVVFDGDDNWDGDDANPADETQVTNGAPLRRFVRTDYVAFEASGAVGGGYEQREDIFRSADGVFRSAAFAWTFRVTNGTRKIRRYEPAAPAPFNDPEDAMAAVLGLDIANSGATDVTLDRITVRFWNVYQFNATTDLRPLADGAAYAGLNAGVLLYRDADGNGVFDPLIDWLMPLAEVPTWTANGNEYRLTLAPARFNRVDDESIDGVYDFFVVVQPDQSANNWQRIDSGDQFYAYINNGDLILSKAVNVASVRSATLTIDSLPPQLTVAADINDADADGYLDNVVFTFHENLQPSNEDAGDWRLTDADGVTDLSPVADSQVTLSANYRVLTIALADIRGTTGRVTYQTLYDGDGRGLFDWAGNPVDFTAAGLQTADDVPPRIVHSGIVVEPNWVAPNGAQGTQGTLLFHDRNGNGQWDAGEDIFDDLDANGQYDAAVDRRLWDGGDAWSTPDGYSHWLSQAGLYFHDADGDGRLGPRENIWIDRGTGAALGLYTDGVDQQVFVRRGEELEYLDLDGNGRIETLRVTFSEAVRDSTLSGFTNFWTNIPTTTWLLAGRSNVQVDPNGPGAGSLLEQNNNILYLVFSEAAPSVYDTGSRPDVTTAGEQLQDMNGNRLNGGVNYTSGALTEDDQAQPVLISAQAGVPAVAGNLPAGETITLLFSEPVTAFTALDLSHFYTDPDGPDSDADGDGNNDDFLSPAFDGVDATLSIVGGNAVITLNEATTSGLWTEFATVGIAGPPLFAEPPDHCVGDLVGHNPRQGTPAVQIRGLGSVEIAGAIETLDVDGNGYLDYVRITFTRAIRDSTVDVGQTTQNPQGDTIPRWLLTNVIGGAVRADLAPDFDGPDGTDLPDDTILYLSFREATQPDTGVQLRLVVTNSTLRSFNGEPFAQAVSTVLSVDRAAPQIMDVATNDADGDGRVDTASLVLSEDVDPRTAAAAAFAIGGIPCDALAIVDNQVPLAAVADAGSGKVRFTCTADHGLAVNDRVAILGSAAYGGHSYAVTAVPGPAEFEIEHAYVAEDVSAGAVLAVDDAFTLTLGANQVPGTSYKPVDYTPGVLADVAGNPLAAVTNAGLRSRTDLAKPCVAAARTLSDRAIEVTFTEDVSNIQAGDLKADFGALSFDNVAAVNNSTHVWSLASPAWNTDADGRGPGGPASTDSTGVHRTAVPNLTIAEGEVRDGSGNRNVAIAAWNGTLDNAAPVVIRVAVRDEVGVGGLPNGTVDTAEVTFSEPMNDATIPAPLSAFTLGGSPITGWNTGATADDAVVLLTHAGVPGTDYKALAYTPGTVADRRGNPLAAGANLGLTRLDQARPLVLSARTRSDNSLELAFSEAIAAASVSADDLVAGLPGNQVAFSGAPTVAANVVTWLGAAPRWNTDATGANAGAGTDSTGAVSTVVPQITLAQDQVQDLAGNGNVALIDYAGVADGAAPVVLRVDTDPVIAPPGIYTADDLVPVRVHWSEVVRVTPATPPPAPQLGLNVGIGAAFPVDYTAGSGSRILVFHYTVGGTHNRIQPDYLDVWSATALALPGGSAIQDNALPTANDANLTLPTAGANALPAALIEIDNTPPVIASAATVDQNTVRVTFSEPISNAGGAIAAAVGQVGILDGAAAFLAFEAVTADAAGAVPLSDPTYMTVYYHMTTPARFWNTDATGTGPGSGTDHSGTVRANVPAVQILAGAVRDRKGQPIGAASFTATADGAPPVAVGAVYLDNGADGSVDRVAVTFSEGVVFPAGSMLGSWVVTPNDLTGLGAAATAAAGSGTRTVTLTVAGTVALTGVPAGGAEPQVTYTHDPANPLQDARGNAVAGFGPYTLRDGAGPAIVAARMVSRRTVEVTLSEAADDATLAAGDFRLGGFAGTGIVGAGTGDGANDNTVLVLKGSEAAPAETGTVAFSAAGVLGDVRGVASAQTAAVAVAPLSNLIRITSPTANTVFSQVVQPGGAIPLVGSAAARNMTSWTLYYAAGLNPANPDLHEFKRVEGTPAAGVVDGELGAWDMAAMPNGTYTLRLRVVMDDPVAAGWGLDETPVDVDVPVILDGTAPTVLSVTVTEASGTYSTGQTFHIQVNFSEPVFVQCAGGTPYLELNTTPPQRATYTGGTGSAVLEFLYVVQDGDAAVDLDYRTVASLILDGCTIRDIAQNDADLTLPAPGSPNSIGGSKDIVIDTTGPDLLLYSPTLALQAPERVTYSYTRNAASHAVPVTGRALADDIAAGAGAVVRVEVTADGTHWFNAALDTVDGRYTYNLNLLDPLWGDRDLVTPFQDGLYTILVRAWDDQGRSAQTQVEVWLRRDSPTADILWPPQDARAMRGVAHRVSFLVEAPYFAGTQTQWTLEGDADGDFSAGAVLLTSGATDSTYRGTFDVPMPAAGNEYFVRLRATRDGNESVAVHRFRLHNGISAVETVDANANGRLDGIRITFSAPVDIIDWDNAGHGIENAFAVTGYTIVPRDYSAAGVTSLVLALQEKAVNDTAATPAVSYVDNHTIVFTGTLEPFVPDYRLDAATDAAAPVLMSAESRSDRSIALFFSEPLDLATVQPADLTVGGTIAFAGVAPDGSDSVILWTAALPSWNTDATGAAAGTGTDSAGTAHGTVLTVTIPVNAFADARGNGFGGVTGYAGAVDKAPPVLVSARTVSDRAVEVVLSEAVAGVAAADLFTQGGAVGFGNYTLLAPLVHRWAAAATPWNTDATGLSAGAAGSTDSTGTARAGTVDLTIPAGAFRDLPGNPVEALAGWAGTTDAAPPVALAAQYLDLDADPFGQNRVDRVRVRFSEPVLLNEYEDGDWAVAAGSIGLGNETAAVAAQHTVDLTALGAPGVTGGAVAPRVAYTRAAGVADSLRDAPGNAAADFVLDVQDGAAPRLISARYLDVNFDGFVDRIEAGFSETVRLGTTAGWTLAANDLAVDPASLGVPVLAGDLLGVSFTVQATAPETGVYVAGGEVQPTLTVSDAAAIVDLSPGAWPLVPATASLEDAAGPVLLTARAATQTVIDVTFSERLDGTTVSPADFLHDTHTVTGVATVDGWAGARLTLGSLLPWGASAGRVAFAAAGVVADPWRNPNGDVARVPVQPVLQELVFLSGPRQDILYSGDDGVPVTGRCAVNDAPPRDDLAEWRLYLVQGQGQGRLPVEDPSTRLIASGLAPVDPAGAFGDLIPLQHATPGVYRYTLVLRVSFTTGEPPMDIFREVLAAADVPIMGTVNDGLGADIDYQAATAALSANWTGFTGGVLPPSSYVWAAGTDPDPDNGMELFDWTNVGLSTSATRPGLPLVNGMTCYVFVRALDAAGNAIGRNQSDGVRIDGIAPFPGVVLDGPSSELDIEYQKSATRLEATWQGFADDAGGSGIASYEWALYIQAGAAPDPATDPVHTAWTNIGNVTRLAATLSRRLIDDQPYYVGVRAIDAVGNVGQPAWSDGFRPDLSGPRTAAVRDSLGEDIDITAELGALSGNWDAFSDTPGSGLAFYQFRAVTGVDQATDSWLQRTLPAQGALNQGRTRFGVARLPDGSVMAIGGWTGVKALASVEVYNPETGLWTVTGTLNQARYGAAVAVLPDGDVIVAGGANGNAYLNTIERYNHYTGTWTLLSAPAILSVARENAAAAVLADGTVWLAGGRGGVNPAAPALDGYTGIVERFDPVTVTVAVAGQLAEARAAAAAYRLPDGGLLVFGGEGPAGPSRVSDLYTPGAGWRAVPMAVPRAGFAHVQLPGGDILALGGNTTVGKTATVERFSSAGGAWTPVAPMSQARSSFGAAWVESTGSVLVAGGIDGGATFIKTSEEYDPDNDVWAPSAPLNRNRGYHSLIACGNGVVTAVGGVVDWLISGETEFRRYAAPVSAWEDCGLQQAATITRDIAGNPLQLELGRTYYFQVRAFDMVGNRSVVATSDGVTVTTFTEAPVVVTLVGPAGVAVGETFPVQVYVRENNALAQGFRGGPLDLNFTAACARVDVEEDEDFSAAGVLSAAFTALGEGFTHGALHNAIGLIDELGGATTANGLGEGAAPGVLYATIPFRATAAGVCTITASAGESGLVLTPPIGVVPAYATDFGQPLQVTVRRGVALSVDGGIVSVSEGSSYRVRASLDAPATEPVTVLLTYDGSTATRDADFTVTGVPLIIGTGTTSAYVTIRTVNDSLPEAPETIRVSIAEVVSAGGGYAPLAARSSTQVVVSDGGRPGDADGDGDVDYYDLLELISEYGKAHPGPDDLDCDFDGDGDVDYYDLLILIANYDEGRKSAEAAVAAAAKDAGKDGPTAVVTLVGPASVARNAVFDVDVYVQVSSAAGFGGGPLTLDFSTGTVDYAGAFDPSAVIQAPFNGLRTSGTLDEGSGRIAELGGGTVEAGHGYGVPVHYARLTFQATGAGTASFSVSGGLAELTLVGDGRIPFANVTYGDPLVVAITGANRAPAASDAAAQTGVGQAVDILLSGTDPDGDSLTFVLPSLGQAGYPAHGQLGNSRPGPVANTRLVTYTPDPDHTGTDTFTYAVHDGAAASAPATVEVVIGGFVAEIAVTRGGMPFATLRLGMQAGASDHFLLAEGDYLAAPAGMGGAAAFFLAPYGEQLAADIRGVRRYALWRVAVAVPAGVNPVWALSWNPGALPDGYACTLTPADADWRAAGDPVDMSQTAAQTFTNSGGTLQVFRFLVAVARRQSIDLVLQPGWNLVGIPLALDGASRDLLLGNAHLSAVYHYREATGYEVPTAFVPGCAYWVYADAALSLTLTGTAVEGGIPLEAGWNLVAPYADAPNPMDGGSVLAAWAWDPVLGYFMPEFGNPAAVRSTMGLWVFAAEATVIWDEAP